jgi:hypothetical protein
MANSWADFFVSLVIDSDQFREEPDKASILYDPAVVVHFMFERPRTRSRAGPCLTCPQLLGLSLLSTRHTLGN